ncbi:MAG: DNA repair protein RecO [Balneolaceae bacterium]
MITHTKAIILKSIDYQESSKILTVLSQEHGKIALIARGVKKPKSKLSGLIDLGNILDVVYYYKSTRGVQSLTEASFSYSNLNFRIDFERAAILYSTLELIAQLVHENEVNETVFNFLSMFIQWLGEEEKVNPSIFCYVQIRCTELCGFDIDDKGTDLKKDVYLNISDGIISNAIDSELSYKLTVLQARFLKESLSSKQRSVLEIGLNNLELKQLIRHLDVYFKYHIEGYKERRSDSIFEQMLQEHK